MVRVTAGWIAVAMLTMGIVVGYAQSQRVLWTTAQEPFKLYGNAYYVGTRGISALLLTSDAGHVLIDGALPESAPMIAGNIRRLGFRLEDVKLIVNSHAHYDHAGGIGELQRLTGARVAATPESARVFEQGRSGPDDPQYGGLDDIARVEKVQVIGDGETLRIGSVALQAHRTGGHTPGGTSWTWRSCEADRCVDFVYADSVTAVSADGFLFTRNTTYPNAVKDFEASFAFLETVPCDVLITPHPEASDLWGRIDRRREGDTNALVERGACARLAKDARVRLRSRLESERKRQ